MKAAIVVVALAACGDSSNSRPIDAPKQPDAAQATTVVSVDCATTTAAATVMTSDLTLSYSPMATTITMGQVVKFVTSPMHDVKPNPLTHPDPGITVGFNTTKCLRFTQTGTFGFMCSVHSFTGTVTVN